MKKIISVIPARSGSKGVANKNIYPIAGKPLINYCLDALNNSQINNYYVSTNSTEIAQIAMKSGAEIIDRPDKMCQDDSPTIDCVKHAIEYLKLDDNDIVFTIQATSPLIISSDINKALEKLQKYDYVVSVCEHHKILWGLNQNSLTPINHDPLNRQRRQDCKKIFYETGSIYATSVKNIVTNNSIHGIKNVGYVEIPKTRSFEIDDYEDINLIESIIKNAQY